MYKPIPGNYAPPPGQPFIAPEFSQYPAAWPSYMTKWLYGDRIGNPAFWDKPEQWPEAGRVIVQDRSFTLDVPLNRANPQNPFPLNKEEGNSGVVSTDLDLTKGAHGVVFSRTAVVLGWDGYFASGGFLDRTPTQAYQLVWVKQTIRDGHEEITASPMINVFGTAPHPQKFPLPQLWNGQLQRTLSACVPYAISPVSETPFATVRFTWKVAMLWTGR
jgi:hypothetical protein